MDEKKNQDAKTERWYWLAALALAAGAMLLHGQSINSPLLFDDKLQLSAGQIYSEYLVPFTAWQRWLSYGTFAWLQQITPDNVVLARLVNVLLHGATVLALYVFYKTLFIRVGVEERGARASALAGALLFGLHPLTVYGVSYLIQRSIVMATLFSVLALYALLKAEIEGKRKWLVLSGLAYILALSSKETVVFLPLVAGAMLILLQNLNEQAVSKRVVWYGIGLLALGLAVLVGIYHERIATPFDEAAIAMVETLGAKHSTVAEHPYLLSVINQSYLFFKYLLLWALPVPAWMSIDMRQPFPTSLAALPQMLGPAMYLIWALLAYRLVKKGGAIGLVGFGMAIPLLLFLTEFGAVWIQDPFVLYRNYLWLIAVPAFLPYLLQQLGGKTMLSLSLILAVGYGAASMNRMATFESDYALWTDAIRYNERNHDDSILGKERAYNERALANARLGRLDAAIADYSMARTYNKNDPMLYLNRGTVYMLMNDMPKAMQDVENAYAMAPNNPEVRYKRVQAYMMSGDVAAAEKQLDEALSNRDTWSPEAYALRGLLRLKKGQFEGAEQDMTSAMRWGGKSAENYSNRGVARAAMGLTSQAEDDFTEAIRQNPAAQDALVNRSLVRMKAGRHQQALEDAESAIAVNPDVLKPHLVRAQILVALARYQEAIAIYSRVLEKNPNEAMAYMNRAEVYAGIGQASAARPDFEKACKLGMAAACNRLAGR